MTPPAHSTAIARSLLSALFATICHAQSVNNAELLTQLNQNVILYDRSLLQEGATTEWETTVRILDENGNSKKSRTGRTRTTLTRALAEEFKLLTGTMEADDLAQTSLHWNCPFEHFFKHWLASLEIEECSVRQAHLEGTENIRVKATAVPCKKVLLMYHAISKSGLSEDQVVTMWLNSSYETGVVKTEVRSTNITFKGEPQAFSSTLSGQITSHEPNRRPNNYYELVYPLIHGQAEDVAYVLSKGTDPNTRFSGLAFGTQLQDLTCLQAVGGPLDATESVMITIAEHLLKAGAKINDFNSYHETPLFIACRNGKSSVANHLISCGADTSICNKFGTSPLHWAASDCSAETVTMLIKHGADVNKREHRPGGGNGSPLAYAVGAQKENNVRSLLEHGADPKARLDDGRTILQLAQEAGNQKITNLLKDTIAGKRPRPAQEK